MNTDAEHHEDERYSVCAHYRKALVVLNISIYGSSAHDKRRKEHCKSEEC